VLVTGITGGQVLAFNGGGTAMRWENSTFGLEQLSDVVIGSTPVDGSVLVYNSSQNRWEDLNSARLDFIVLTDEGAADTSLTIYGPTGPAGGIGANLNISLLTQFRGFLFPDSTGTLALQNQYSVTRVVGASQSLAGGETRFATANCPVVSGVQTIAVGASMEASPASVSVRALTVDLDAQSRPTIARVAAEATNGATNITAVAMCLRLP